VQSDKESGLEIYAKVEDLLGVSEVAPKLYSYYYRELQEIPFNSLIDVGCGSGTFLAQLEQLFPKKLFYGIDKSRIMVERAQKKGLRVANKSLSEIRRKFDLATATFDMINYLQEDALRLFFNELSQIIQPGGYFLFDINSEYGLSELAVGSFTAEDSSRFIAIESFYEEGIYESNFTLFEREGALYRRFFGTIEQYLYQRDFFESLKGWEIKKLLPLQLYEMGEYDKELYIMQKR